MVVRYFIDTVQLILVFGLGLGFRYLSWGLPYCLVLGIGLKAQVGRYSTVNGTRVQSRHTPAVQSSGLGRGLIQK